MLETDRRGILGFAALVPFLPSVSALAAAPAASAPVAGAPPAWDLTDLYPDFGAWDAARQHVLAALPRLKAYKGTLGQSAAAMARALSDISDVNKAADRVEIYASLKGDEDLKVAANQERLAQTRDMGAALGEATAWSAPEIVAVGKDRIESFVASDPTLKSRFAFSLRNTLRQGAHVLDVQGETLLAGADPVLSGPEEISQQLLHADVPWPTVTLSDGRTQRLDDQGYTLTRDAPSRADRKKVFDTFWGAYGQYRNSLGASLLAKVKGDVFVSKARHYPSSLAMALAGDNVPETVYRTLVAATGEGLPQLHRYFELRRRMLKLPDIRYYDIYPPLVTLDRKFSLPEMRTITLEAVKPLGPEYGALLARSTAAKWMDPLPRPGKASGAYMNGGAYDVHPYLLLNLGENYEGLTTFAHEWGHAMHTLLAKSAQPYETSQYATFTAEIASTCNEALLVEYMIAHAQSREEKLFYLGQKLEGFRGTYFRQTMFGEFELKIHDLAEAAEGLSGEKFTALYLDLLKRYHGPKFIIDDAYAVEWSYIPHFYRFFYVYQYATSITAGTWFAHSVLNGGAAERELYLDVLRAGGSDYPVDILKRAGLDMTTPEPYRQLVAAFGETIDAVEKLL
jgi:oligoendopeptidase F